jgi:hypothetical protein
MVGWYWTKKFTKIENKDSDGNSREKMGGSFIIMLGLCKRKKEGSISFQLGRLLTQDHMSNPVSSITTKFLDFAAAFNWSYLLFTPTCGYLLPDLTGCFSAVITIVRAHSGPCHNLVLDCGLKYDIWTIINSKLAVDMPDFVSLVLLALLRLSAVLVQLHILLLTSWCMHEALVFVRCPLILQTIKQ